MPENPGDLSAQAANWLNHAAQNVDDTAKLSLFEQRARDRAAYQPAIDMVLAETQVSCTEEIVAGVACLVITPAQVQGGKVVLYAYGGGFTLGSPEEDLPISARIAALTGVQVIAPRYRLAPEHPFPAGLEDIWTVAQHLLGGADDVVFAGESAGANLLLSTLHRARKAGLRGPSAAALMSPAVDQQSFGCSFQTARDPTLAPARVAEVAEIYAPGRDLTDPDISPIFGSFDPAFPPLFVTTGTRDLFLSQSVRLAQVMRDAGAQIDLRVWEGMWHVFEFYPELPEAQRSLREVSAFLSVHL